MHQVQHHLDAARGARGGDARVAAVVAAVGTASERVAATGGDQAPAVVDLGHPPADRVLAPRGEALVDGQHIVPGGRRRGHQRLVVQQRHGLHAQREAPGLALQRPGAPGLVIDGRARGGRRRDGVDQAGAGPAAEPVVRPDPRVGALAGGSGLLELGDRVLGVLHLHRDARIAFEGGGRDGQASPSLVAVDPHLQRRRAGARERGQRDCPGSGGLQQAASRGQWSTCGLRPPVFALGTARRAHGASLRKAWPLASNAWQAAGTQCRCTASPTLAPLRPSRRATSVVSLPARPR